MTIASDIINCRMPDFNAYLSADESLDDIDEYGFTPLIETAITRQPHIAVELIKRGVDVNKPDVTGRTALHWAVDNHDLKLVHILLQSGADVNAYTKAGLSILVYPVLRGQNNLKHLLLQYGARLDFAMDFIYAKLLGHRYELSGDVDIINASGEFIELDYEGFILEFTVAVIKDSLRRFTSSYATKEYRHYFPYLYKIMDAFTVADELLQYQQHVKLRNEDKHRIAELSKSPMLILPAASRGHALCFIKFKDFWAKIDRGENSIKEGCVNIFHIGRPELITAEFIQTFLYKKHSRNYFHQEINQILQLRPVAKIPMTSQISGNCSWANVQAVIPVAYAIQDLADNGNFSEVDCKTIFEAWGGWDKDRALDECIQRFYLATPARKASFAAMLGAVLFQACDHENAHDLERAEKILAILTQPDYYYILSSYLEIYCVKRLTRKGNNLLKILDDCGFNPGIGVTPIATGLKERDER